MFHFLKLCLTALVLCVESVVPFACLGCLEVGCSLLESLFTLAVGILYGNFVDCAPPPPRRSESNPLASGFCSWSSCREVSAKRVRRELMFVYENVRGGSLEDTHGHAHTVSIPYSYKHRDGKV